MTDLSHRLLLARVLGWLQRLDDALDQREEDVLRFEIRKLQSEVDALKRQKSAESL